MADEEVSPSPASVPSAPGASAGSGRAWLRALGEPVALTAWTRTELQVTRDGVAPVGN